MAEGRSGSRWSTSNTMILCKVTSMRPSLVIPIPAHTHLYLRECQIGGASPSSSSLVATERPTMEPSRTRSPAESVVRIAKEIDSSIRRRGAAIHSILPRGIPEIEWNLARDQGINPGAGSLAWAGRFRRMGQNPFCGCTSHQTPTRPGHRPPLATQDGDQRPHPQRRDAVRGSGIRRPRRYPDDRGPLRPQGGGRCRGGGPAHPDPHHGTAGPVSHAAG